MSISITKYRRRLLLLLFLLVLPLQGELEERQRMLDQDLFLAIEQKNTDTALELLSYGADINARDENGHTPLMYAVAVNDVRLTRLLVRKGADLKLRSNTGRTALEYATRLKRDQIQAILGQGDRIGQVLSNLDEDLEKLRRAVRQSLQLNIRNELQTTWEANRKQRLTEMQQRLDLLHKMEAELKKLEDEDILAPGQDREKQRRITLLRTLISQAYDGVQQYLALDKREEARRAAERIRQMQELQRRMAMARALQRDLDRLRQGDAALDQARRDLARLGSDSSRLYSDVYRADSKYRAILLKHMQDSIPNAYDKQRFKEFFDKGVEQILYTGKVTPEQVIAKAMQYLGQPYVFGGLDCSGLWQRAFEQCGITTFPRTAELQARYGRLIPGLHGLKKGDMLYFTRTYSTYWYVTHIAMYLGDDKMLHAANGGVQITAFPNPGHWWRDYYVFAARIWE